MAQVADPVAHLTLGIGHIPEQMSSSVRSSAGLLAMHGHNARKPGYSAAEAHGRRPASPRWSPHFRPTLANAVCASLRRVDDVHVRWSADDEPTVAALVQVGALQRFVDGDSRFEALKPNPKALSHPRMPPPNSLRFRQAIRNTGDYHPQMTVSREEWGRESPKIPRRRLWKRMDLS